MLSWAADCFVFFFFLPVRRVAILLHCGDDMKVGIMHLNAIQITSLTKIL